MKYRPRYNSFLNRRIPDHSAAMAADSGLELGDGLYFVLKERQDLGEVPDS
jgi:hypothetical protein